MKTGYEPRKGFYLSSIIVISGIAILLMALPVQGSLAGTALSSPLRIGGVSDYGDERDVDMYPKIAYEASTGRYLVVWMSLRNATSSSDGFDIYGIFLDQIGQPIGSEFRISDSNTVARSSFPTVIAGNNEFIVAWTAKATACQIVAQKVTDTSNKKDLVLIGGNTHRHSPQLVYNSKRQRYMLVYVDGDDYRPPTLFGAQTATCADNASSSSSIKAAEFYFNADIPTIENTLNISEGQGGGFRPNLVYSPSMDQYFVSWEDRRNAAGQGNRFDIYAQRLSGQFALVEKNISLASGGIYTNYDSTATWTPRPATADGKNRFLTVWYTRTVQEGAVVWSVVGNFIPASGAITSTPFPIAAVTFAQSHTGKSPAGYLSIAYSGFSREYLVGMSNYMESVWGYMSLVEIQRLREDGQLLNLDGSPQTELGSGYSVDYENEDQLAPGMAVIPTSNAKTTDFMIVYSKHLVNKAAQDTDIWNVRYQQEAYIKNIFLPMTKRGRP